MVKVRGPDPLPPFPQGKGELVAFASQEAPVGSRMRAPFPLLWRGAGSADRRHQATFAAVREAIARRLTAPHTDRPLEPYPEQVAGARALLRGEVAEMATGEGKTITAAFAAACWAREGPVHVATANAYLAARDAAWLGPVYADLGLRTGVVTPEMGAAERRRQYACDVVYSTLAELGFDYLRDRLVTRAADRVQRRGLGALIVDEADLLLIDEARTPLVIARPSQDERGPDLPHLAWIVAALVAEQRERVGARLAQLRGLPPRSFDAAVLAAQLRRGAPRDPAVLAYFAAHPAALRAAERAERDLRGPGAWMLDDGLLYSLDERARTAYVTEDGQALIEQRLGPIFAQPAVSGETLAALHNLILAFALFARDRDYLVRDGRVVLIEEATGRAAESRRYMHGLHAAIEVKELGAPLEDTETLAQISVQQFVRQYARRAGMTGTAMPAAEEFARTYGMQVRRIPRHRPNRRVDLPPRLYRTAADVDRAVVADVAAAHALGRPVLVGTQDVARSERLSALLTAAGLPHAVLNAREHAREAETIAAAGRLGAITIATNMAGRGTDIRLQDRLEELLVARAVAAFSHRATQGPLTVDCASPRAFRLLCAALARVPGLHVAVLRRDRRLLIDLTPQAPSLKGRGSIAGPSQTPGSTPPPSLREGGRDVSFGPGLYVIATEPHAARRLDDQLRGRSGRQGDEGVTRLYASLEDETLRFYGVAHRRAGALRALSHRPYLEGRAAQRVIDDAQRRAARMHYGQRRTLFELDLVVEAQRKAMLSAYERALQYPNPDEAVRAFVLEVGAGELARRPAAPAAHEAWEADLIERYGVPEVTCLPSPCLRASVVNPGPLAAALLERYERAQAEAGSRWQELARAALLRAAAELWARHVDMVDDLQRQAPVTFASLPAPVAISYAKEASRLYAEYVWAVKAETLSALLTLPQPYERALPPRQSPSLSAAAAELLALPAAGSATGAHDAGATDRDGAEWNTMIRVTSGWDARGVP